MLKKIKETKRTMSDQIGNINKEIEVINSEVENYNNWNEKFNRGVQQT